MLIRPRALKSQSSIEKIQPRMMVATFNGNPSATIISCYSPNNVSEEIDLIAFYDELSFLVCSIPKHNVPVIGGDMNSQIGKNVNHKFSLHNSSNKFYVRKSINKPQYKLLEKGGKTMDLHLRK